VRADRARRETFQGDLGLSFQNDLGHAGGGQLHRSLALRVGHVTMGAALQQFRDDRVQGDEVADRLFVLRKERKKLGCSKRDV